jgi:glucan phosphoethanolaminetransferase (alkaline phosphatase superfamily)
MEVYLIIAVELFAVTVIVPGPLLGVLRNKSKEKEQKAGRLGRYFSFLFFSMSTYYFALDLIESIHERGARVLLVPQALPYIGLVLLATLIILSAFLTLRNSAVPLRWIIFAVISSGVIASFLLLLECETNPTSKNTLLTWSLVAYFAPQLLLFFDKERKEAPPGNVQAIAVPPTRETSKS